MSTLRQIIFDVQKGFCAYCQREITFEEATLDHVRPKSRGGCSGYENLVVTCQPCNTTKGGNDPTPEQRLIAKRIRAQVQDVMIRTKQRYRIIQRLRRWQ
jgi:uncharacterized protein (TIGR02646 family)